MVTTAGPLWESELVERARYTGALRIAQRASQPSQVHRTLRQGRTRAVLMGGEIPWLSRRLVDAWRHMGAVVIGIDPSYGSPRGGFLEDWGCDLVLDAPDPHLVAAALRAASPSNQTALTASQITRVIAVGGPRGAPGRTEVALGLAWLASKRGSCLLIEADDSPALGLRLGLPPPSRPYQPTAVAGVDVLLWRADSSPTGMLNMGWAQLWNYRTTVVDLGPGRQAFGDWPGQQVVVCQASPSGIVRGAYFLAGLGPGCQPWVVVNNLDGDSQTNSEVLHHLGSWAGRDPDALIRRLDDLRWGKPPPASLLDALEPLSARLEEAEPVLGGLIAPQHAEMAHRHQVRVKHFGQPSGSGGMDEVDKEPIPPGLGGGARFYPGEVGASGR